MAIEIRNAIIKSTMLGTKDHGIMTCYLYLDYGGEGQAFGGSSLIARASKTPKSVRILSVGGAGRTEWLTSWKSCVWSALRNGRHSQGNISA